MARIYVSSSWHNKLQPELVQQLRQRGHQVYDFRHPKGRNDCDVWLSVTKRLGLQGKYNELNIAPDEFREMMGDDEALSRFNEHLNAMKEADICVLLLHCNRSAHAEAGFMAGLGKKVYVWDPLSRTQPELMYLLFDGYFHDNQQLFSAIDKYDTLSAPV